MKNKHENICLFIINTEFVLLVSLLYYYIHLKEKKNLKPIFIFIRASNLRFINIKQEFLPGESHIYKNDLNETVLFPDKEFLEVLKIENVNQIVYQNPQAFTNQCIINYFKTQNAKTKLTVVSDSIAMDRRFLTNFKEIFIAYSKFYYRKFINQIPFLTWKIWTYHSFKYMPDELIAHRNYNYPIFYNTKELFSMIPQYFEEFSNIFNIDIDIYQKSDIIFFTQPNHLYTKYTKEVKEGYISGVKHIFNLAKKNKKYIIVKVHPSESIDFYNSMANEFVYVDTNSNTPAEIILNGLTNKKIVSYFSSISMYDIQKKNRHFWLYKTIGHQLPSNYEYDFITYVNKIEEIESFIFN